MHSLQSTAGSTSHCGPATRTAPSYEMPARIGDWQDGPVNRWSFQHVRELIPSARISRGLRPSSSQLPRLPSSLDNLRFSFGKDMVTVGEMLQATFTDAFLVLHQGRILTEQYSGSMMPSTPHLLQSVSKSITSTVAGILVGRRELFTADPVTCYVDELSGTSFDNATVRQLLDMRTGTKFVEDYANAEAEVKQYEQVIGWAPRKTCGPDDDLHSFIRNLVNDRPHGGKFEYRSILTDLLGWILERASGMRFADLVSRELWSRLGAEFDAEVTVDLHGHALADGGISATLRDLGRFGQLMLQNGWSNGRQVVPVEWVRDCWQGDRETIEAFDESTPLERCPDGMYRNNWWVRDPVRGVYYGAGVYGQRVFIHLPANVVIAKLSTWPDALNDRLGAMQMGAFEAIADSLMH